MWWTHLLVSSPLTSVDENNPYPILSPGFTRTGARGRRRELLQRRNRPAPPHPAPRRAVRGHDGRRSRQTVPSSRAAQPEACLHDATHPAAGETRLRWGRPRARPSSVATPRRPPPRRPKPKALGTSPRRHGSEAGVSDACAREEPAPVPARPDVCLDPGRRMRAGCCAGTGAPGPVPGPQSAHARGCAARAAGGVAAWP